MLARFFIGVGEAAYGSVGLAVVLAVFPVYRRASLTGAFMAGGSFGSVLGVALGGVLAVQFGWRWSFGAMAILGLVLVVLYRAAHQRQEARRTSTASTTSPTASRCPAPGQRAKLRTLFSTPSVICRLRRQRPAAVHRRLAVRLAAQLPQPRLRPAPRTRPPASPPSLILLMGVGMIVCGVVTDRLTRHVADPQVDDGDRLHRASRWSSSASASPCTPGTPQLLLLAVGVFFAAGTTGPAGAMVANLTPESIRATAFGTLTLANNLLGLAAGPLVIGILADRLGLVDAMKIVPMVAVGALVALLIGRKSYPCAASPRCNAAAVTR